MNTIVKIISPIIEAVEKVQEALDQESKPEPTEDAFSATVPTSPVSLDLFEEMEKVRQAMLTPEQVKQIVRDLSAETAEPTKAVLREIVAEAIKGEIDQTMTSDDYRQVVREVLSEAEPMMRAIVREEAIKVLDERVAAARQANGF